MDLVPWLLSLPQVASLVFLQRFTTSRPQKQPSLSQKQPAWWQRDDAGGIEADTGRLKKQPPDVATRSQRFHWTQFISADKYEVIYVYTWRISYPLCPSFCSATWLVPGTAWIELFELVVSRYHWLEMVLMLLATGTGLDFEHRSTLPSTRQGINLIC